MQKLINQPSKIVDEAIKGFVKCNSSFVQYTESTRALKYVNAPIDGKVGVVSGGGAGHEPAFMGYIGENMLDAVAIGDIFTPPSSESFYSAFKAADAGKGVVCLCGNYIKDIESAKKAVNRAAKDGINVKIVIVGDDVAGPDINNRRGLTGEVLAWKISGAAAALKYSLEDVVNSAEKAVERMRSIGIGLSSCNIPEIGSSNYIIEEGTMEIGVGHHGLQSKDTCKLKPANATADIMISEIIKDMPLKKGDDVGIMVSGLGNTMLSELYIIYNRVEDVIRGMGTRINHAYVGNFFTSLDMMGVTLTIISLDDELKRLLELPAYPRGLNSFY